MATGYSSSATTVTTVADLYEKTNTNVKTGIKLKTEEAKWFRSYPTEMITVSGNENRVPLVITQPISPSMIPDGGSERIMSTPAPTHGTFLPVQMNVRFGYTGLAQALTNRARGAMIESQTDYQAEMAVYSIGRGVGLQTYGTYVGTVAVVKTTGSSSTTQTIALKNAYGSSTWCAGGDSGVQDQYLSNLFRVGDHIALIRSGSLVEFAAVTSIATAGSIDATFTSAITPTANDLIVFANADGDSTITGTDYNNSSYGFTDGMLGSTVMNLASTTGWPASGSTSTTSQRLTFAVKEKMINDCWNNGGVQINRFIVGQGTRRDAITGQLASRRYDSSDTDLEGDLKPGDGEQFFTSQLAPPQTFLGWYDKAVSKIELSDQPEDGAGRGIFQLDKVQGKSQMAAAYNYFYQRIFSSRNALGYATNLQSS